MPLYPVLAHTFPGAYRFAGALMLAGALGFAGTGEAQTAGLPSHPAVPMYGTTYTPLSIVQRNMGSAADQTEAFAPHHVIGNIYYVGTRTLSSFLIVTPAGNILIDSTYERNVAGIERSVAALGFSFADIKILLGNHAHGDHMEGDALVKQRTGAQVEAMAEDIPLLDKITPEGKPHPVDRVLHDGDQITLGGTTLVAHLTAGHTPGCTTFTTTEHENGKTYHVVFGCSLRAPAVLTPAVNAQFLRTFGVMHALPCDVMLGDHPGEYGMTEKYARLKAGAPNPFIDAETCHKELDIEESMYYALFKEQSPPFQYTMPDHPQVTFDGKVYSPQGLLSRNMGSLADESTQFPPHRIIGNLYYVGTRTLSSFLIVTPKGNILIDTIRDAYVPVLQKSVADLGFKFSDIKLILGTHAHSDHIEGNARVKQLTGAEVDVMDADVPAMTCRPYCFNDPSWTPDGKDHPVDRVLHDGDIISLGGTTLTAHLTAGHTAGCTSFTTTMMDHGKPYHVIIGCSLRSPSKISPEVATQFGRSFQLLRDLPCDVYVGDHPSFYGMAEKYGRIKPGAPNPFIDKATCHREIDLEEAMFYAVLQEQEEYPPVP